MESVDNPSDFIHLFEPSQGGSGRTLLLLHGTGGSERDLIPLAEALVPGAALLSPRGKVLEGGVAARFFRRHGEGNLDLDDLVEKTDELAGFVRNSARVYGFELAKLTAIGFSNGANIATSPSDLPNCSEGWGLLSPPTLLRGWGTGLTSRILRSSAPGFDPKRSPLTSRLATLARGCQTVPPEERMTGEK